MLLNDWERDLLNGVYKKSYEIGVGLVTVTHTDGTTSQYDQILYEANRMENGFLTMETSDHDVFHVCNPRSWIVTY